MLQSQQWTNNPEAAWDFPLVCSSFDFMTSCGDNWHGSFVNPRWSLPWFTGNTECDNTDFKAFVLIWLCEFCACKHHVTRLYHRTWVFKQFCFPDLLHGWFQPAMQIGLWCVWCGLGFDHLLRWDFFNPLEKNVSSVKLHWSQYLSNYNFLDRHFSTSFFQENTGLKSLLIKWVVLTITSSHSPPAQHILRQVTFFWLVTAIAGVEMLHQEALIFFIAS